MNIWVGERRPLNRNIIWCKNYKDAIFNLDSLLFSEDIINNLYLQDEKSSYTVVKHIIKYQIPIRTFKNLSGNPIISQLLINKGYKEKI